MYLVGYNRYSQYYIQFGAVAQPGERFNGIEEVRSSILLSSTIILIKGKS
tara:strand:- start:263 stop:412 length:150 start_codon:yes stop_codon:yes gene_type:complete